MKTKLTLLQKAQNVPKMPNNKKRGNKALSDEKVDIWLAFFQRKITSNQLTTVLGLARNSANSNSSAIIKKLFDQGIIEVKK